MEALEVLGGYPTKPLNPRARMVRFLLSIMVCMGCLLMLHSFLNISKSRKPQDFYSFEVKDANGKSVSLERYRGKVSPHQQNSASKLTELSVGVLLKSLRFSKMLDNWFLRFRYRKYIVFRPNVYNAVLFLLRAGVSGCQRGEPQRTHRQ